MLCFMLTCVLAYDHAPGSATNLSAHHRQRSTRRPSQRPCRGKPLHQARRRKQGPTTSLGRRQVPRLRLRCDVSADAPPRPRWPWHTVRVSHLSTRTLHQATITTTTFTTITTASHHRRRQRRRPRLCDVVRTSAMRRRTTRRRRRRHGPDACPHRRAHRRRSSLATRTTVPRPPVAPLWRRLRHRRAPRRRRGRHGNPRQRHRRRQRRWLHRQAHPPSPLPVPVPRRCVVLACR